MVHHLGDKVVVVFTDRTPEMVKEKLTSAVAKSVKDHQNSVFVWDSTKQASTQEKINIYESIIQNAQRVILTADLDYATAHAVSKRYSCNTRWWINDTCIDHVYLCLSLFVRMNSKPVYIAFAGQARSYLSHFHRWLLDAHLTRKLRLDKSKSTAKGANDPYSYLGDHVAWGNASKVFQTKSTMAYVKNEIEEIRAEKVTGKRRK